MNLFSFISRNVTSYERMRSTITCYSGFTNDNKASFLFTFMNWGRMYIEDLILSMIDFIDWLFVK